MDSLNVRLGSASFKIPLVIVPLFAVLFLYAFFAAAQTFSVGINNPTNGSTIFTSFINVNLTTDQNSSNCTAHVAYLPNSLTIASNASYIKSYMNANVSTNQTWYVTNFTQKDGNYAVFAACNDTTSDMSAEGLNISYSNTTAADVVIFAIETNTPIGFNSSNYSFAGNASRLFAKSQSIPNGSVITVGSFVWNITLNASAKNVSLVVYNDTMRSGITKDTIYYFLNSSMTTWGITIERPFNTTGSLFNNNSFHTTNGWYTFEVRANDTGLASQSYNLQNQSFLFVTGVGTVLTPVTVNVTGGGGYLTLNYTFTDKFVDYCRFKAYSLSNTSYSKIKNATKTYGNCTVTIGYDELEWPGEYNFENLLVSQGNWNTSAGNETDWVFSKLYAGWNFLAVLNNETLSAAAQRNSNITFVNVFNNTIGNKTYYSYANRVGVTINAGIDLTYGDAFWVRVTSNTGIFRNVTVGKGYYADGRNVTIWNSGYNQIGFLNKSVTLYQKAQEPVFSMNMLIRFNDTMNLQNGTNITFSQAPVLPNSIFSITNATGFSLGIDNVSFNSTHVFLLPAYQTGTNGSYFVLFDANVGNSTVLLNKITYYDRSNSTTPYFAYVGRNVSTTQDYLMYKGYGLFVRTNMTGNNNTALLRVVDV